MKILLAFFVALNLSVLAGCGGGTMDPGPPAEGTVTEEPAELTEEETAAEEAADPNAGIE